MKIGKDRVVILCGGSLDEAQREAIANAAGAVGLDVAGVITDVTQATVTGDDGSPDGEGVAFHNIYAPAEVPREVKA